MNNKIENFLEKWNEMLVAANEIEEFKFKLSVTISSDDNHKMEREETISGINKSFVQNKMNYQSSSSN